MCVYLSIQACGIHLVFIAGLCVIPVSCYVPQLQKLSAVCRTRESQSLGLEDIFFLFRNDTVRRVVWGCDLHHRVALTFSNVRCIITIHIWLCITVSVTCRQDTASDHCQIWLVVQTKLHRLLNVLKVKELSSSALQSSDNISDDVSGLCYVCEIHTACFVYSGGSSPGFVSVCATITVSVLTQRCGVPP